MHLTQGPPFPCCKALVTTSAVCPSQTFWWEAACHPRAFGCGAGVGSSVCFSRGAELFSSVTLSPAPEFAVEVLYFSVALAEEEVLVGKVLKKLPECVEESTLRMQISAILFSLTFFSSLLCFTYCWGCLCSPVNHFWKCTLQSCWFYICSQLADSSRILTCTDSYRYVEEDPAEQSLNPLLSLDPCCTFGVRNRSHFIFRIGFFLAPVSW